MRLLILLAAALWLPASAWAAEPLSRVEENYQFRCAQCHGVHADGKGPNVSEVFEAQPANLTDATYMSKFTDQQIFRTLTYGGPINNLSSLMPPWGGALSEEERWELVRYIRTLCGCRGAGPETAP